jgi:putative glutamine amidotransferase
VKAVGLICDSKLEDGMAAHRAGDEYVRAVTEGMGALPLLIPATALDPADILLRVDGLLFTGSPSNVAPRHYGGEAREGTKLDEARDAVSLPLIRAAAGAGVPMLCICRGFQELNVALGGSLIQHIHEQPGALDHREDALAPLEAQYAHAHAVTVTPGGMLDRLLNRKEVMVNSLHAQGIALLASRLRAEARAPDGLIEAVSLPEAGNFVLGVQWHPEWDYSGDPVSRAIFAAFAGAL